ncbi:hypothetical protein LWC33_31790 [Pseudonocardia sp. RS11V-5]|uniref:hypothetical protein n=1 Tax=Pseudonocardia terrae TaxID=2905831 RepID=UPI001E55F9AB|nr:hypothetical protein [Pseudonocardia terrae]MCE3556011.1 hypothetical protein [Pseudonocardia terrae]
MDGATARTVCGFLTAGALSLLLAGCGGTSPPGATTPVASPAPVTSVPATPSTDPSAAQTTVPQAAPTGTPLLWPVTDLPGAQNLQTQVDGGAQPWTLDPEEVAISYATTTYGWKDPDATTTAPGAVDVTDDSGATAHITLVQPVRAGATGIWVVSAATRG